MYYPVFCEWRHPRSANERYNNTRVSKRSDIGKRRKQQRGTKEKKTKGFKIQKRGARAHFTGRQWPPVETYIDELMVISLFQVIQNRRVVQIRQVGHVLAFFVLGRVHLAHLVLFEIFHLTYHTEKNAD